MGIYRFPATIFDISPAECLLSIPDTYVYTNAIVLNFVNGSIVSAEASLDQQVTSYAAKFS